MGAEIGATTSTFPFNDRMSDYLVATNRKSVPPTSPYQITCSFSFFCFLCATLRIDLLWSFAGISDLANQYRTALLNPDPNCQYDRLIEIDLSKVGPCSSHSAAGLALMSTHSIVVVLYILFLIHMRYVIAVQLEPHVNGPFTPDLAHPISQLGKRCKDKGWPVDIKVGTLHATHSLRL